MFLLPSFQKLRSNYLESHEIPDQVRDDDLCGMNSIFNQSRANID